MLRLNKSVAMIKAISCLLLMGVSTTSMAKSEVSYHYATVVDAEPIIRTVSRSTPREQCWDQEVVVRERRNPSATGAIMGGIIGAAIGHELGHHKRNKQVGAVAGAILGSSVGNDVSRANAAPSNRRVVTETTCQTVYDSYQEEEITGYRVIYRYNGKSYTTRTRQHPGDRLKLRVSITPAH